MDNEDKVKKLNKMKLFMVNNSHKIDLIVGISLIIYSIYGYMNNKEYYMIAGICGLVSLIFSYIKPVKYMNNKMEEKFIKKD